MALRHPAAALIGLALAACQGDDMAPGDGALRASARRLLAEQAAQGPVPLVLRTPPAWLAPTQVAHEAARGVRGLAVRFEPDPAARGPRLALWFAPPPGATAAAACRPGPMPGAPGVGLLAVYCDAAGPIAEVASVAPARDPDAAARQIWRSTALLFPDDYADSYGLDLFGWRVRLGAEVGL